MTDLDTTPDLDIAHPDLPEPRPLPSIIVDLITLRHSHREKADWHITQSERIGAAIRELHGAGPYEGPTDIGDRFVLIDAEPEFEAPTNTPTELDLDDQDTPSLDPTPVPAAVVEPFTKPTGRAPRESRYDFEQIAMWIYTAKSNGTYTTAALADRFNVPTSTAKNWVGECRKRGLNVDPPAMTVDHPEQPGVTIPLTEIVATYLEATTAGRRPIQTIVDRYDVDRTVAQAWVNQCREQRLLPSRDEPQIPAEAPQQYVHHTTKVVSL